MKNKLEATDVHKKIEAKDVLTKLLNESLEGNVEIVVGVAVKINREKNEAYTEVFSSTDNAVDVLGFLEMGKNIYLRGLTFLKE